MYKSDWNKQDRNINSIVKYNDLANEREYFSITKHSFVTMIIKSFSSVNSKNK